MIRFTLIGILTVGNLMVSAIAVAGMLIHFSRDIVGKE